ncbi:MAG: penicillin-binding transpeptidase domain-containing protein [Oscillospiraceae bacterium]
MRFRKCLFVLSLMVLLSACGTSSETSLPEEKSVEILDISDLNSQKSEDETAETETTRIIYEPSFEEVFGTSTAETSTDFLETMPTETTEETTELTQDNYRGCIYDANGIKLTYTDLSELGNPKRMFNDDFSVCFSNVISDDSKGLDSVYDDIMRKDNNTDCTTGRSVQVTYDALVQRALYSYMAEIGMKGSIVVMRTDGSLMAEVSYPSYDANRYSYEYGYPSTLSNSDSPLMNKAEQTASPGSCFKMMSEVIADKNNITVLDDEGEWMGIHNWDWNKGGYPKENRTLADAFRNSSNIYFAKVFEQLGKEKVLDELGEMFNFVNDKLISCDFGGLRNSVFIENDGDLRRTGFGQANVKTSPVFLAALTREAIFGQMVKPFTLKAQVNSKDYTDVIEEGTQPYEVIAEYPQKYNAHLLEGMAGVAEDLGAAVPAGYKLYCKTGTAEVGRGDYLYVSGCLLNDNDNTSESPIYDDYSNYAENGSYIIITQLQNPDAFGFSFASNTGYIYKRIMAIVTDTYQYDGEDPCPYTEELDTIQDPYEYEEDEPEESDENQEELE